MFALEVLLENISLPLVPPALAASLIATATSCYPIARPYTVPSYPVTLDQILYAGIIDRSPVSSPLLMCG